MNAALATMPVGMTILEVDPEDAAQEILHLASEADDAASAVLDEARQRLATSAGGSVTLAAGDVAKLISLLELVQGRTAATLTAAKNLVEAYDGSAE